MSQSFERQIDFYIKCVKESSSIYGDIYGVHGLSGYMTPVGSNFKKRWYNDYKLRRSDFEVCTLKEYLDATIF